MHPPGHLQASDAYWRVAFDNPPLNLIDPTVHAEPRREAGRPRDRVGAFRKIKPAAASVQSVVIPGAGRWVAEQAPEELLAALTAFLAPYRDRR